MFGIGMQEVLLVLILALIFIGPKKLPEVAKALGKGYGEFRRAFEDMRQSINVDVDRKPAPDLKNVPPADAPPDSTAADPYAGAPEGPAEHAAGDEAAPATDDGVGSPAPPDSREQSLSGEKGEAGGV